MKKNLLLLPLLIFLFMTSCKKEVHEPAPDTIMDLYVMKQNKSSTGQITVEPVLSIIHVWKADNREFDVAASPDLQLGYAYDKISDTFITIEHGAIGSKMRERLKPGKYFIHILLPKSTLNSSLAYSYSYFEIKEGETLKLKKVFNHNVGAGMFEEWDKNK